MRGLSEAPGAHQTFPAPRPGGPPDRLRALVSLASSTGETDLPSAADEVVAAALFFGLLDAGCLALERDGLVSHGLGRALTGTCVVVYLVLEADVVKGWFRRARPRGAAA